MASFNQSGSTRITTSGPPQTLASAGLYTGVPIPRQSQAANIQGTDNRAYTRSVGQNELAATHLNQMTDSNDPYMANARRRGLEQAARRGMLNSSIAGGNAERAAIEAASPFAMQAAGAYGQAQTENLGYLNQNLMQERDINNQQVMRNLDAISAQEAIGVGMRDAAAARQHDLQMQRENLAFSGEQRGLDRAHDYGINEQGFGHDVGRMALGQRYNLESMGYDYDYRDRNADRDHYRTVARDNNTFSNQRYGDVLQYQLANSAAGRQFILDLLAEDPATNPQDLEGFSQWLNMQLDDDISSFMNNFFGG